ncbi:MAG: hypothetical protein IT174_14150 [Acidobacteria bacterium]|nr:hypothetical protein [Acidobacteriota bacterium]
MKNSINLVAAILIFVVLGCACPKLDKFTKKDPPPPPAPANSSTNDSGPSQTPRPASKGSISMDSYNQLKTDMSKTEVEGILGGPGEELSSSSGGGLTFTVYKWLGKDYSAIIVTFQNGKLKYKSQVGLK